MVGGHHPVFVGRGRTGWSTPPCSWGGPKWSEGTPLFVGRAQMAEAQPLPCSWSESEVAGAHPP
eukprot:9949675-Alexandrium_andersonii.AAC.1